VFLREISLLNFRNILTCELSFSSRVSVFVGGNGQGKTSLLEAIYLLSHSKSFRTTRSQELISKFGTGLTKVDAELDTNDGSKTLSYSYNKGKREIYINSTRITSAKEFYGTAKVIDFTPDDLFIVKGAPGERRRYIDKLLSIVDPEYLESLVRYQRALKNRNALLNQNLDKTQLQKDLVYWEGPLIESGEVIARKRDKLIEILNRDANKIYSSLTSSNEQIACKYKTHFESGIDKEAEYRRRLERDIRQKSTTFGIHRDDLVISIDTGFGLTDAKEIASQGQTRSAALALKLAGIDFLKEASDGEDPIVLLDDVESELDQNRREFLLGYLLKIQSQILIATTNKNALPGMEKNAQYFVVSEGKITSQ
jgi:DNA replication and repair protein RecF